MNYLDEAMVFYKRSLEINPQYKDSSSNLAALYQAMGRVNDAADIFRTLLPYMEKDAPFFNNYGALLGLLGKFDQEKMYLQRALTLNPNLNEAHTNLAGHYQEQMEIQLATEHLEIASRYIYIY